MFHINRTVQCLAVFYILSFFSVELYAKNIIVPDDHASIQEAINAAADSDEIMVRSGTYYENINFRNKSIRLYSKSGASSTIIDGSGAGTVVTFNGGEDESSVLDGFTIQNGSTNKGAGIYCSFSSPVIKDCIITNNAGEHGGGISCYSNSSPTIVNCTISNNTATHSGGALYSSFSSPSLVYCTISDNTVNFSGGGIYNITSSTTIANCTISGNSAGYSGGGVYCETSPVSILNSIIIENRSIRSGGGVSCNISSSASIVNTVIVKNEVQHGADNLGGSGGGVYCGSSSPSLVNCTISGNTASRAGGGIFAGSGSYPSVTNSIVWDNAAMNIYEIYPNSLTEVTYSNIKGGYNGKENMDSDPLFSDPDSNDYTLQSNSPCIDAGTSNAPASATDMESKTRFDDPNKSNTGSGENGTYYDIGAYEKQGNVAPAPSEPSVPTLGEWGFLSLIMFFVLHSFGIKKQTIQKTLNL